MSKELDLYNGLPDFEMMTISEMAISLSVSHETIRRIGKRLFPELFVNGKTTIFSEYQATSIKNEIGKGRTDLPNVVEVANISTDIDMINKTTEVISWLLSKNKELKEKADLADAALRDESTHYSIRDAGKHLGLSQTEIFRTLRNKSMLTSKNLPSQNALVAKILTLRTNVVGTRNIPQAVMTMQNIDNFRKRFM
jgi:hypothetical protein